MSPSFGESFDLLQFAVVEPLFVFGKTILRDPNHVPGASAIVFASYT